MSIRTQKNCRYRYKVSYLNPIKYLLIGGHHVRPTEVKNDNVYYDVICGTPYAHTRKDLL